MRHNITLYKTINPTPLPFPFTYDKPYFSITGMKCLADRFGDTFSGRITARFSDGRTCIPWYKLKYQTHIEELAFPDDSLKDAKNYCRNPDYDISGPWCYISNGTKTVKHTCDIVTCCKLHLHKFFILNYAMFFISF